MIKGESIAAVILLIFLVNMSFLSAITGAIGNAKMVLYPEVNGWTNTVIEKSILVKNPNDAPINATLALDAEGEKFMELIDKSFILEPNTEKPAEFVIKVKKEGTYKGKINIFFTATDGSKTGVALTSEIIVIAKKDQGYDESSDDNSEEDNTEEEMNSTTKSGIVGRVVDGMNGSFLAIGVFGSTAIILVVVLVVLMIALKKGEKRRKKVNAREKK